MKRNIVSLAIALVSLLVLAGCKKEQFNEGNTMVAISVEFDNIVGGQNLILGTATNYNNAAGEQFNISTLQYFISNIKLRKTDGTEYIVPQDSSYFLIKEDEAATRYCRFKAPQGDYSQLTFTVGVDSLLSTMDISKRTGVLDPSAGHDGMYWSWNSGYIFLKLQGSSPSAPVDATGQRKFRYHIGGFGGYSAPTTNNIRTVTLDLAPSGIAQVRAGRSSNVHVLVDIMKVFNGATTVSIAANSTVMFGDFSRNVADNYRQMFRHDHTEN